MINDYLLIAVDKPESEKIQTETKENTNVVKSSDSIEPQF